MPEYEVMIRYRIRGTENDAHVHGLMTGEKLISTLSRQFPGVPYVRVEKPQIVSNA